MTPLPLNHSKPTFGYLITSESDRVAYLTDTKGLPPKSAEVLGREKLDLMVIDSSHLPGCDRPGHNTLDDALVLHDTIAPQMTVLTHIGHDLDVWLKTNPQRLPAGVLAGYDEQLVYPFAEDE